MSSPAQYPVPVRRRSMFGPLVLIGAGVIFLLVNLGWISRGSIEYLFARYWPVLLILWGLAKMLEYYQARRDGLPAPGIGAGGVVFLIFLMIIGSVATHVSGWNWGYVRDNMQVNGEVPDFFGMWGTPYTFVDQVDQDFPAKASVKIAVDRGDVVITEGTDNKLHVTDRKTVYADSQDKANAQNVNTKPVVNVIGDVVNIEALRHGQEGGYVSNLEIQLPRNASIEVITIKGNIEIRGREGNVKAHASKGSVTLHDVKGNADVHLRKGDFKGDKVTGDVLLEGRVEDTDASDIGGSLSLSGDFMGQTRLMRIAKGVKFRSSRTDLEFTKLEGNFTMDGDDLHANALTGPFRLQTRSKNIHLEDVSGDVQLENNHGEVELHTKLPLGKIRIQNRNGSIQLSVPDKSAFEVTATADNGEIQSEFDLTRDTHGRNSKAVGTIGKGGPTVQLSTDHGNIDIKKS